MLIDSPLMDDAGVIVRIGVICVILLLVFFVKTGRVK